MRRYLIVANQTLGGQALLDLVLERHEAGPSEFYVLVPATPPLDYALGAGAIYGGVLGAEGFALPYAELEDDGEERAQRHLAAALERLAMIGVQATGEVGELDPLEAIESVLRRNPVDEILLSTLPSGISRWLKMDLVNRARRRFDLPITHVYAEAPAPI